MLRSYLIVAVRNLWRHRSYSVNGVLSLAVSLVVCLLLVLLFYEQWQYDRHHDHAERIYRVVSTAGSGSAFASSPAPLGPVLQARSAGVEVVARVRSTAGEAIIAGAGLAFDGYYVEPSFFDLFNYPVRAGASPAALEQPYQAFLSASWAERVFGDTNPVGRSLDLDGIGTITVAGVLDAPPGPTHLQGDVFLSFATLDAQQPGWTASWEDSFWTCYNYVLLAPDVRPGQLDDALADLRAEHFPDADPGAYTFRLQSVTDIALGPRMNNDSAQGRGVLPRTAGYFLGGLGLIVLLAASFTFTNLSLARILQRTREVGVRKTVGASRGHVIAQFLVEALVLAFLALGLALAVLPGLVSLFNGLFLAEIAGIRLHFDPMQDPVILLPFLGVAAGVGLCAGLYPAWALSAPSPARVIRGHVVGTSRFPAGRIRLRRGLLGVQVGLSFVLIVSTLLMYRQSAYELGGDYGFDTERLVQIRVQDASLDGLQQTVGALPGVVSMAAIEPLPVAGMRLYETVRAGERELSLLVFRGAPRAVVSTLGVELVAGTLPSRAAPEVVINETAARQLGIEQMPQAVGKTLRHGPATYTIRGVVKDFHVDSFRASIEPVAIFPAEDRKPGHLLVRAHPDRHQAILDRTEAVWSDLDPIHAFEGATYRRVLGEFLAPFRDTVGLIGATALFALLVTGLGLLGVAAYVTQARRKEVGVRKVLGASVATIAVLLSREFLAPIGAALVVALPLGWLLNDWWLGFIAYRIDVGPGVFFVALAFVLMATLGTAGLQAWRTARLDPVRTLRDE